MSEPGVTWELHKLVAQVRELTFWVRLNATNKLTPRELAELEQDFRRYMGYPLKEDDE